MIRKCRILLVALILLMSPALAQAAKTTYVHTDRKFNYVKRVEKNEKHIKEKGITHPYTFSDLQIREMLSNVKLNRKAIFKKESEEEEVFDSRALDYLVPYLVQAFKEANPNEEIVFSVLSRKSTFLVRDDRMTIVGAWVSGGMLHLDFHKLMAKISPNYDKMSDVSEAINRAQGLRVALDVGPGQQFGKNTDEMLLTIPDANALVQVATEKTEDRGQKTEDQKQSDKKETEVTATAVKPEPVLDPSIEGRLRRLENLRKKGLINKDEYEGKRKEILEQL
ncbi:MAG: SHOCT domain-containing protein [Deltaproteobacteria bacterium]|nr:SHOCT domain-containing protein [Deltaproteobacteria bacterium]